MTLSKAGAWNANDAHPVLDVLDLRWAWYGFLRPLICFGLLLYSNAAEPPAYRSSLGKKIVRMVVAYRISSQILCDTCIIGVIRSDLLWPPNEHLEGDLQISEASSDQQLCHWRAEDSSMDWGEASAALWPVPTGTAASAWEWFWRHICCLRMCICYLRVFWLALSLKSSCEQGSAVWLTR